MGDDRVLVLTPSGRDASLASSTLRQAGIGHRSCTSVDDLCAAIREGAGLALVASEALGAGGVERLHECLADQPSWSDLPLIILTPAAQSLERNRRTLEALARLGNVTALERPVYALGMLSAVRAALRARRRQYETRDLLRELGEAVRQRERFLAILGHELRNPLGAIRNAVALARRHQTRDGTVSRTLSLVERQSRILDRLVDDLLDVSRVTSGKIVLRRENIDLGRVALQALEQVEPLFLAQRIDVTFVPAKEALVVDADPARIEQILANLLTNAVKYTPENGRVTLRATRDEASAVVAVEDTGIGIARDLLPRIFDLFAQGDRSLDRTRGGLGIGLTLAKGLAELHGGSLVATSEGAGHGSTFALRLPLASPITVARMPDAPTAAGRAASERTVLLVEDSPDNRESLRELLEFFGHTVYVAGDGIEGLARALELRPDVAIIDLGLPRLNGYDVAKNIRTELGDGVLLIALTGYGLPEDRQRSYDAGFDAHVTKPADIDELERVVTSPREHVVQGSETR